jgi:hypothetical protein
MSDRSGLWDVLPRWVKVVSVAVALPAWLWWVWEIISSNAASEVSLTPFLIFGAVALIQIFFIGRAFWRMEL